MGAADPVQSGPFSMVEAAIAATLLQAVKDVVRAHLWCLCDQGKSTSHLISDNTLKK